MIRVGIIGATGYTGQELVRLLSHHRQVEIDTLVSRSYAGQPFSSVFPAFRSVVDLKCSSDEEIPAAVERCDVLFMALPHGLAAKLVTSSMLENTKLIDLGADFRLKDGNEFKRWYEMEHPFPEALKEAVYGLSEWHRDEIRHARLIANPGCYATCSELALLPLAKEKVLSQPIIDAKSGVSGAGRSLALGSHFNETNETIKAYKIASHRHTPEIEQELAHVSGASTTIVFTPHLIPMNRGILVTAYCDLPSGMTSDKLFHLYKKAYEKEPFVRLLDGDFPETRWVKGSNYCDIGLAIDERARKIIVIAAIDNLVKGAAGQAIQNMNIMFEVEESAGLTALPVFP